MRLSTICESIIGDFEDAEMEVMTLLIVISISIAIKKDSKYQQQQKTSINVKILRVWPIYFHILKHCNTSISKHLKY